MKEIIIDSSFKFFYKDLKITCKDLNINELITINKSNLFDISQEEIKFELKKRAKELNVAIKWHVQGEDIKIWLSPKYPDLANRIELDIETTNLENFTINEYYNNLVRLGINNPSQLINKFVYYVKPDYGIHKVLNWDRNKAEYLLYMNGSRFWSNPFCIHTFKTLSK